MPQSSDVGLPTSSFSTPRTVSLPPAPLPALSTPSMPKVVTASQASALPSPSHETSLGPPGCLQIMLPRSIRTQAERHGSSKSFIRRNTNFQFPSFSGTLMGTIGGWDSFPFPRTPILTWNTEESIRVDCSLGHSALDPSAHYSADEY